MDLDKKKNRYNRLYVQLQGQLNKTDDPIARMATTIAILHHKMDDFFWTGFYILRNGELTVGPYQGALACQVLEKNKGVCWAGINQNKTIIVPDVELFPGHIACDSRSKSEIVIPLRNKNNEPYGVLDVDSTKRNAFDEIDAEGLEMIVRLIG
jgi:L-methionine (R)-S-oxide reductase